MEKLAKKALAKLRLHPRRYYYLLGLLVLVLIGAGWLYFSHSFKNELPKRGSLAEDQQFPATPEAAYKNLDIKIAEKAQYFGSPVQKIRDLGVQNNVRVSVVSFKVSPDNLTEFGLMTEPTSPPPAKGYPVLVLLHGYVTPKRYSTTQFYLSDMEEYSRAGSAVIKPDLRGQGLSQHVAKPEGAYYSMAYNTDVVGLLSDIKATRDLDSSNINLWGHSMGAYIALRAAVMSPEIKNVILLSGPVGDIQDMFSTYVPVSDRNNPVALKIREAVLLRYGDPVHEPVFWRSVSPLSYLSQLNAHVQIHVGTSDSVVPPRFSEDLDRALRSAGKPPQYFVYKGGSHGLVDERPQIYQRSLQLLLDGLKD